MEIDFHLDHGDCENDKCILCCLERGQCPWCSDETGTCEHIDKDSEEVT